MRSLVVVVVLAASHALAAEPRALSIDDAIALAQQRSEAVAAARARIARADAVQLQAFSEWLPQVNGSLTYDRLLVSEYAGILDATNDVQAPAATPLLQLPFGATNTFRAGVSASQNLFAGGRTMARQRIAASGQASARLDLESVRAQVVLDTVQAYYNAVLADRFVAIAESTLHQAELALEQTLQGARDGTRPEFDLLRAQVAYENEKPPLVERQNQRSIAHLRLKQLLDLPLDVELRLVSVLESDLSDLTKLARAAAPAARPERVSVRQAQQVVATRAAAVDLAFSQYLPTLGVATGYAASSYPPKAEGVLDDIRHNWTVGAALQVPIFSGLRITGEVSAARADLTEAVGSPGTELEFAL